MTDLLTAARMRTIEQAAIASGAVTGRELMERAGQGVVEAIFEEWPGLAEGERRAAVLCGPGNNGGDGFVVARLLAARGWTVEVYLHGDRAGLPPDAAANAEAWDGPVRPFPEQRPQTGEADLIVDAMFGTGLSRPLADDLIGAILGSLPGGRREGSGPRVVAVDLPTGLHTDTGKPMPKAVPADLTVTFHSAKLAHYRGAGPQVCGRVVVKDIGL